MKVIIEYRVLKGQPLKKVAAANGIKVIEDRQMPPDKHADFPLHRVECYVPDESDAARAICELLGYAVPG